MNELIFFTQTAILLGFTWGAHKLGKEALVAWICTQVLVANLFVLKAITLFGLKVTPSDPFIIGSLLGLSFLQEYHSKEDAQKATQICFCAMLFFVIAAKLHLLYQPSLFDTTQEAFSTLLTPSLRLFTASFFVFFLVQRIDILFFQFLKNRFPFLNFSVRTGIALTVSQFLDTALFSFAGLYGVVESVIQVIAFSFCIKMVVISMSSTFLKWVKV